MKPKYNLGDFVYINDNDWTQSIECPCGCGRTYRAEKLDTLEYRFRIEKITVSDSGVVYQLYSREPGIRADRAENFVYKTLNAARNHASKHNKALGIRD